MPKTNGKRNEGIKVVIALGLSLVLCAILVMPGGKRSDPSDAMAELNTAAPTGHEAPEPAQLAVHALQESATANTMTEQLASELPAEQVASDIPASEGTASNSSTSEVTSSDSPSSDSPGSDNPTSDNPTRLLTNNAIPAGDNVAGEPTVDEQIAESDNRNDERLVSTSLPRPSLPPISPSMLEAKKSPAPIEVDFDQILSHNPFRNLLAELPGKNQPEEQPRKQAEEQLEEPQQPEQPVAFDSSTAVAHVAAPKQPAPTGKAQVNKVEATPKIVDLPRVVDIPGPIDIPGTIDVPGAIDIPRAAYTPRAVDTRQTADTRRAVDTPKVAKPSEASEATPPELQISGIMTGGKRPVVLIGNQLYGLHDQLDDTWKIVAITPHGIKIQRSN